MKPSLLILCCVLTWPSLGQVVSNVKWELENNERILITYDLAKQDSYIYFDVSVKAMINNETITPKSLEGDAGSFIKIGTNKKIIWNIFEDVSELNGELSVEVVAYNPVPSTAQVKPEKEKVDSPTVDMHLPPAKNIPFWVGMGGVGATGAGFLMNGLKSKSEGKELYDVYKNNRLTTSTVYQELGSSREDVYGEANKKFKSGTLLSIGGAAVLVAAGAIMVNRIIQMKKLKQRSVAVTPYMHLERQNTYGKIHPSGGLTFRISLH